jgi:hypothetical protein
MSKLISLKDRLKSIPKPRRESMHVGDIVRIKSHGLLCTGVIIQGININTVYVKWPSGSYTTEKIADLTKVKING